jgi:hypothetical protein
VSICAVLRNYPAFRLHLNIKQISANSTAVIPTM